MAKQNKGGNAQRRTRQQPQQQNFQNAPQGQTFNAQNPYPQNNPAFNDSNQYSQNPQYGHNGNGSNQPQGNFGNQDYDNELHGALFKNQRKFAPGGNPAWPDYTGNAQIGGIEYWVSAWSKKSKSGQPYLSISFTAKYENQGAEPYSGGDLPF